jgi:hypothetical protein
MAQLTVFAQTTLFVQMSQQASGDNISHNHASNKRYASVLINTPAP